MHIFFQNDVTTAFMILLQLLSADFSEEEQVIVALPSQEQIAMLLTSLQIQTDAATVGTNGNSKTGSQVGVAEKT